MEPELVVVLGATAAQSLLGPKFRVTQQRGVVLDWPPDAGPFAGSDTGPSVRHVVATIHPSAVLRADPQDRPAVYDGFVDDLRVVAGVLT